MALEIDQIRKNYETIVYNNHLGKYNVATCVKHYFGYGAPRSGKHRTPAYLAPNMIREKYFEPFKCAIEAGAISYLELTNSVKK